MVGYIQTQCLHSHIERKDVSYYCKNKKLDFAEFSEVDKMLVFSKVC